MITKWKIEPKYKDDIEPIEVVAETACFVTVLRTDPWGGKKYERRMRKDGSEKIFDTFKSAKEALIEDARRRVKWAEAELQSCKTRLKKRNDIKTQDRHSGGISGRMRDS